jgi:hypothetical protein
VVVKKTISVKKFPHLKSFLSYTLDQGTDFVFVEEYSIKRDLTSNLGRYIMAQIKHTMMLLISLIFGNSNTVRFSTVRIIY